jgi:hypothetical protein
MAEAPEAVRAALEAGVRAGCEASRCAAPHCIDGMCRYEMYRTRKQISAFLRALPTGNGYSPHDLAAAVDAASTITKEPRNG